MNNKKLNCRPATVSLDSYRTIISKPEVTLVMYDDPAVRYPNDELIRRVLRKLALEYSCDQLANIIIVDVNEWAIEDEERPLKTTFRLYRESNQLAQFMARNAGALRASLMEFAGKPAQGQNDHFYFNFVLAHGVRLKVWNPSGRLTAREIADGLARAMREFKREEADWIPDKNPYRVAVNRGRKHLGRAHLEAPMERGVTRAQWLEAVIHAYSAANMAEQILDNLPSWKAAAEKDGSERIGRIVAGMQRAGGDLHAISILLLSGPGAKSTP